MLETSELSEETVRALQRKLYLKAKHLERCACLRKKNIGKPYAGEPRVRFDEGRQRDMPIPISMLCCLLL